MANSGIPIVADIDRFFGELSEGMRRQGNVIFALMFRQFLATTPGRSALSMLWVLVEPATNAMTMAVIWMVMQRNTLGGVPPTLYLLISFLPYLILKDGMGGFARALTANSSLFAFQRIKPIDLMIARMVIDITLMIAGTIIMLFILYWFFADAVHLDQIGWAILMMLMTIAMTFGLGLLVGTYGHLFPIVFIVLGFLSRGMLIASGVILAPQDLPFNIQLWFSWNPSAVIIDQMRVALFHTPPIPQSSIPYCLFVTLCLDGVGLLAYYSKRHKLAVDA